MGVCVLFIPSKIQANFNPTRSEEAESAPPAVNQPQENQKGPKLQIKIPKPKLKIVIIEIQRCNFKASGEKNFITWVPG